MAPVGRFVLETHSSIRLIIGSEGAGRLWCSKRIIRSDVVTTNSENQSATNVLMLLSSLVEDIKVMTYYFMLQREENVIVLDINVSSTTHFV